MLRSAKKAVLALIISTLLLPSVASAAIVEVTDNSILPGQEVRWTADNTYLLNGFVFVDEGATLTIEPGTTIKGKPGQGEKASALIVARGGKIFAQGTAQRPIIFTAEADNLDDPDDLPIDARGLWGGVIILGRARLNSIPGETPIEGIPTTESRGLYGGTDDEDNSGVLRYVSIRYGGTDIGAGNEINGLTLGGVGSKTVIEYIEVFNNQDDGFEWFGGTVNTRYLVSAFNGDDCFDYDEGFRGKGQFWFAIQSSDSGNRGGEHDGGTTPEDGLPYAIPLIYNATYIGSGVTSLNADNDLALILRDNAGGKYFNSIFVDFNGKGVDIEDLTSGEDSRSRLEAGDIVLANNLWWNFGAGNTWEGLATKDWIRSHLSANANRIADPLIQISRLPDGNLDPRPLPGSPAFTGIAAVPNDGFFIQTDYLGAFGSTLWLDGWTFLSQGGYLTAGPTTVVAEESKVAGALPAAFELAQNFPNPFNPRTSITYSVPFASQVRLAVYDILGRQVAVLVDGLKQAGTYQVQLDASDLANGTYCYRLETETAVLTRKMTLLK